jgi:hypothetical protein
VAYEHFSIGGSLSLSALAKFDQNSCSSEVHRTYIYFAHEERSYRVVRDAVVAVWEAYVSMYAALAGIQLTGTVFLLGSLFPWHQPRDWLSAMLQLLYMH